MHVSSPPTTTRTTTIKVSKYRSFPFQHIETVTKSTINCRSCFRRRTTEADHSQRIALVTPTDEAQGNSCPPCPPVPPAPCPIASYSHYDLPPVYWTSKLVIAKPGVQHWQALLLLYSTYGPRSASRTNPTVITGRPLTDSHRQTS